jgi:plasmid stabilization system protein ParE
VPAAPAWHPEAIKEARAAREWYSARNAEAADAFMAELDTAIQKVEEGPRQWLPYLGETRRYLLRRFPFFVVFREVNGRVEIVAVAHARRRPGYWIGVASASAI